MTEREAALLQKKMKKSHKQSELHVKFLSNNKNEIPPSLAVQSLAGGLSEDDALQLPELQDLQVADHHLGIRHHVVGQISRQHLCICLEGYLVSSSALGH